jgi:putative phosphoribosyl transferase
MTPFANRVEAGRLLAEKLATYAIRPGVLVLGLPRGGVPVAAEVARHLRAPLDVLLVRKLGLPGNPELAMGAIVSGGRRVLNRSVIDASGVPAHAIEKVIVQEERELERRDLAYRGRRPAPKVTGRPVIVVDDGIATGSTMRVAVAALRDARAGRIVVAAPVASRTSYLELRAVADEFVVAHLPRHFGAVGQFYEDFTQTSDAEVCGLLAAAEQAEGFARNP